MARKHPALAGLIAGAAVIAAGCGTAVPAEIPPATVSHVPGSDVPRLRLSGEAVRRLGITTGPVRELPAAAGRAKGTAAVGAGAGGLIPYSAVVYDTDGSTWTYVNTAAGTYRREPITVVAIRGDTAVLSSGPPEGAAVVTVGAAELLGTEYNISGEQ
jgi:hypothetical protein